MPFTESDTTALETWLAAPLFHGQAMHLDKLQGFLCAVVSSPEIIPPSAWVGEVLGGEPDYESLEQATEFMGLLMGFYNQVATDLLAPPLQLILKPLAGSDSRADYQAWCEGYILGWGLSTEEWLRPGNEALKKLTFPILYLSGAFKEEAERSGREYVEEEEDRKVWQDCVGILPQAVVGIFNFWLARRKSTPIRREITKVGRNDLCPCGSGKKYKQCCGSPQRLH
ncbi:MAG: UPF0149 family protein [Sulfuricella sp.]|nr:UPF0149 family protein [Sulfuricella sp.]